MVLKYGAFSSKTNLHPQKESNQNINFLWTTFSQWTNFQIPENNKITWFIEIHILKFVYLWDKKQLHFCFCDYYDSLWEIRSIHTRQAQLNFDQYGKLYIRYTGAILWNVIPF